MARRKVMLPNWANTEEASKSVEMLNEAFEGLTQGELVINTKANNTLLTTLNENGTPVIFESSEMINKRLEGFLENIQQPDNKDVLDGIDSEKVAAWDKAVEDVNTLTSAVTGNEKVVAAALNQIVESVGLDENGNSPLPGNISLTDAVSALSGSSHAHANKGVLDGIDADRVATWDTAKAGAISSAKTYADSLDAAMNTRVGALERDSHTHTNKTVLDGIDSEKVAAWDKAIEDVNTLTSAVTDNEKVVAAAFNQIIESVGLDENCNSLLPGNISLTDAIVDVTGKVSTLSGYSHTHANKTVLDGITSDNVTQWNNAEPNVITEISAITKDNSNIISVNGKKVIIDLSNIESTPGPKGDDGITPVFTAITANVNNATGVPYVSVTSAKTDGEKYALTFDFQNLKGEKGDRGDDGTSIKILGTVNSPEEFPAHPSNGDGYMLNGHLWVYDGNSWTDAGEIKGPQGDPGINAYITAVTASVSDTTGTPTVKVTTGGTHSEMSIDFDFDNLKGPKGDKGTSITSIDRTEGNGAAGTTDVYTITYSDGTTSTFNVYNGEDGINGNNGITPVFTAVTANVNNATGTPQVSVVTAKTADEKYSMEFSFQNMKGEKGDKGDKGDDGTSVKILGTKHSYNELPLSNNANGDGYIIGENLYVWNGSTWVDVGQIKGPQGDPGTNAYISAVTASVSNTTGTPSVDVTTAGTPSNISFNLAFNGLKGSSGNDGIGIKSFVKTNGNGAAGTTDTYTITFTNGETSAITVYNGSNGTNGKDGASGAAGTNGSTWYNGITEPSTGTGVDGDWYINTSTWNVYHKESNSWAIKGNIKGETGSFDDSALSSYALKSEIPDISGKVDKVYGKGLSTNDFTDDLKNKLDGIAAGAEVNVQSEWDATSGDALILHKPSLAKVATSGSYNDLTNTPTIPDISGIQSKLDGIAAGAEVNVQPDWNETTTTSDAYIKNKPTLATVAISGSYDDLKNTPKIPSVDGFIKNISLTTSAGKLYIVGSTSKSGTTASLNTSTTDVYMQDGEVYAASDERLKDFGDNVEVDFNKLSEIPKVYYSWKNDEEKRQMIGTSAQKLKEIYPELVSENEDGKLAVSYEKLSIIALAAIDKLYKENEELKDRLKRIEEKLGL